MKGKHKIEIDIDCTEALKSIKECQRSIDNMKFWQKVRRHGFWLLLGYFIFDIFNAILTVIIN